MPQLSSPHGDKLRALVANAKLPPADKPQIEHALQRYEEWRQRLFVVDGSAEQKIAHLVELLNEYKLFVDLELIFDSPEDFLYRQKGQLKLDNTVLEEFLPIFVTVVLSEELATFDLTYGNNTCFSSVYFNSSLAVPQLGGGLSIREKAQDFVIGRKLFIRAAHNVDFTDTVTRQTYLAYVAVECKTNLDKTMFQEAAATALDLKTSVPAAKYYLLCEWLDMTPISSSTTAIDEVIILRKAKRLAANVRNSFNLAANRKLQRTGYEAYLRSHPFSIEMFDRFSRHIRNLISDRPENDILELGHF